MPPWQSLPSAEFEGVLHPVFEEDEWKLIAVGGLLGISSSSETAPRNEPPDEAAALGGRAERRAASREHMQGTCTSTLMHRSCTPHTYTDSLEV